MSDQPRKNNPLKTIIVSATAIVVLVSSILSVWFIIEDRLHTAITTSTINITKMIQKTTKELVDIYRDDLKIRQIILMSDIDQLKQNNKKIPQTMFIKLQAVTDQLKELENKKW